MGNELLRGDWFQKHQQQVVSSWSNLDFVRKTIAQITKDFAKFNLNLSEYPSLDANTKENLLHEMTQLLRQLSDDSPSNLTQLIYIIDLPEVIFQALLNQEINFFEDLSEFILVREAYKVYLRSKY